MLCILGALNLPSNDNRLSQSRIQYFGILHPPSEKSEGNFGVDFIKSQLMSLDSTLPSRKEKSGFATQIRP
jgi:hypothetical protein